MWNKPSEKDLKNIPSRYSTEETSLKEKIIYMHFFLGGSDWYVCEYDSKENNFFGFVILNNDYEMAEWGYFSLKELCELELEFSEVDRDLYFQPTEAKNIPKIKEAQCWN